MLIIFVVMLAGGFFLAIGLIGMPLWLKGSGTLRALVRSDMVVVFSEPSELSRRSIVATRGYLFVLDAEALRANVAWREWVGAHGPGEAHADFDDALRARLYAAPLLASDVERIFCGALPESLVFERARLAHCWVDLDSKTRGLYLVVADQGPPTFTRIASLADARALQQLLSSR